jgi:dihydrofolate reductase
MRKVIADQSMSLDGFSTGPNVLVGNPLGDGRERLHEWMFRDAGPTGRDAQVRDELFKTSGAVMMGRRMFDLGVQPWENDPPFHMPVFVVTHRAREPLLKKGGTTYIFVADGIEDALAQAKAAASDKDVAVVGGATTIQQLIKAGLIDELRIHLVPVLLGDGTRFFDRMGPEQIKLERTRVIDSPETTHLTFKVVD